VKACQKQNKATADSGSGDTNYQEFQKHRSLQRLQDLLLKLAEDHPDLDAFKGSKEFEKVIFVDTEMSIDNVPALINNVQGLVNKMT